MSFTKAVALKSGNTPELGNFREGDELRGRYGQLRYLEQHGRARIERATEEVEKVNGPPVLSVDFLSVDEAESFPYKGEEVEDERD